MNSEKSATPETEIHLTDITLCYKRLRCQAHLRQQSDVMPSAQLTLWSSGQLLRGSAVWLCAGL